MKINGKSIKNVLLLGQAKEIKIDKNVLMYSEEVEVNGEKQGLKFIINLSNNLREKLASKEEKEIIVDIIRDQKGRMLMVENTKTEKLYRFFKSEIPENDFITSLESDNLIAIAKKGNHLILIDSQLINHENESKDVIIGYVKNNKIIHHFLSENVQRTLREPVTEKTKNLNITKLAYSLRRKQPFVVVTHPRHLKELINHYGNDKIVVTDSRIGITINKLNYINPEYIMIFGVTSDITKILTKKFNVTKFIKKNGEKFEEIDRKLKFTVLKGQNQKKWEGEKEHPTK